WRTRPRACCLCRRPLPPYSLDMEGHSAGSVQGIARGAENAADFVIEKPSVSSLGDGALFRVLSIEGEAPPAHLAGWKDTLLVSDRAELLVAFNQRATPAHPFMYHCHILEHEDGGLMGQYVCA